MSRTRLPIPLPLIALDGAGALLFALGAAGHFGGLALLTTVLPQMPSVDLIAMVLGGVLMGIAMVGIVRATLQRARQSAAGGPATQGQPGLASSTHRRERR